MQAQAASGDKRRIAVRAAIGLAAPLLVTGVLGILAPFSMYLWLKAFHLVAVFAWMGGMIGVIYLFAWHARTEAGSPQAAVLSALERRLVQRVVNPAMVIAWGIGLWLAWRGGWFSSPWLHAKLGLVLVLSGLHGWVVGAVRRSADGAQGQRDRFYVGVNVATVLLTVVVIVLAVVRPI
jgi:putative membrane protein